MRNINMPFWEAEGGPSTIWREREEEVKQLRNDFANHPNKEQAYEDLRGFAENESWLVRREAVGALGYVFEHIPDKTHAWTFLCSRLAQDKAESVQRIIADVLVAVFSQIPDEKQAWSDLHGLITYDGGIVVRRLTMGILSTIFSQIPENKQAWEDLHWLAQNEDRTVQQLAAYTLGHNFPKIPDKKQVLEDLQELAMDKDRYVRTYANHSLGRASIFKATETESEGDFRKEIKKALDFFERSSKDATSLRNPSCFCFPFYNSFYTVMFEKEGAKDEVQRYISEAKSASEGSKNKETLLKAIEYLASALTEAQKITDFDTTKSDLKACMQYCHSAADLIHTAEVGTPGAAQVLWRGIPIIDQNIRELLEEVKNKSESICEAADLPESELGCRVGQHAATALATDNPLIIEREIDNILSDLEIWSHVIRDENEKGYVQDMISDAKNGDARGKVSIIRVLLGRFLTFSEDRGEEMPKYNIKIQIAKGNGIVQEMDSSVNCEK